MRELTRNSGVTGNPEIIQGKSGRQSVHYHIRFFPEARFWIASLGWHSIQNAYRQRFRNVFLTGCNGQNKATP